MTTNEWELLRHQFDATMLAESVESIEDIFDAQFRRRFVDLINQIAQPDSTQRHRIDWHRLQQLEPRRYDVR